jgi:hypothetical protein
MLLTAFSLFWHVSWPLLCFDGDRHRFNTQ